MDAAQYEQLAIAAFERVRDGRLARAGDRSFDFEIQPGQARMDEQGVWFTLRLIGWEGDSIRDVKEQEVVVIPVEADDERVPAYLDGLALGIQRLMQQRPAEVETMMPHDFIPFRAFRDSERRTVEEFALAVTAPKPAVGAVALDDVSGTEPIAVDRDLERAIEEDPDRVENYLVYADWLTERGDPRGELVACSAPTASPTARRKAGEILAKHERYFAGQLMQSQELEYYVALEWALGWIAGARVWSEYDIQEQAGAFVEPALRGLFALPSSKFLQRLTIGCFDFEGNCDFSRLYPIFTPRPTLRELFIGDTTMEQQELSWTRAGDLAPINALFPNLRRLKVRAGSMSLANALAYPKLESLVIECGGLAAENVCAIAAARLPELTELEIWFGRDRYGGNSTIVDIVPILQGEKLPKLTRLALRNCEFTDEICEIIGATPIIARLRELDLSMGVMTDAGAADLVKQRAELAHLAKLVVDDNYLTSAGVESLAAIGIEVASQRQKRVYDGDDGRRYASVGE